MAVALDAGPSENGSSSASASSASITYSAGAIIVFSVSVLASRTVNTPTDTNGLTWTLITSNTAFSANSRVVYAWWAYAASGGTTTITATIVGGGSPTWVTQRMSVTGCDTSSPVDVSENTLGGAGLSSPQTSAVSLTSVSDALIVACWSSTSRTYSADTGNGFTIGTSITTHPFQYKIGSVSAATIPFTWTTGTVAYAAIAFSLKSAAAAGGMAFRRAPRITTLARM